MTDRLREIYLDFRPRHGAVNFRVGRSGTASMAVRWGGTHQEKKGLTGRTSVPGEAAEIAKAARRQVPKFLSTQ